MIVAALRATGGAAKATDAEGDRSVPQRSRPGLAKLQRVAVQAAPTSGAGGMMGAMMIKKVMMKSKLEYIWLDGYMPTQSLRSKTQVIDNFGLAVIRSAVRAASLEGVFNP